MRRLLILWTILLTLSLNVSSQTVTSDSVVCIELSIARQIAQDLIRLDQLREIQIVNDSIIVDLKNTILLQNDNINDLNEINTAKDNRISILETVIENKDIEIANYKHDLEKSEKFKRFFSSTSVATTAGIILLILL